MGPLWNREIISLAFTCFQGNMKKNPRESVQETEGVPIKKLAGSLMKSRISGSPSKKLGGWRS